MVKLLAGLIHSRPWFKRMRGVVLANNSATLKSPYPWFGGKSTVVEEIWARLGDVQNLVDPFFGSGAVLLGRPQPFNGPETVNDINAWLTNFWRAVQADPEGVAKHASYPVSEVDLHARGDWLFYRDGVKKWLRRARRDPEFYDIKSAGWWVWGACCWIGAGWGREDKESQRVRRKIPILSSDGQGIHRKGVPTQLPHLGNLGRGIHEYMIALSERFRGVRICCGDWKRILGPSVTVKHGLTAVIMDPPYGSRPLFPFRQLEIAQLLVQSFSCGKGYGRDAELSALDGELKLLIPEIQNSDGLSFFDNQIRQEKTENGNNPSAADAPCPAKALICLSRLISENCADSKRVSKELYRRLMSHLDLQNDGVGRRLLLAMSKRTDLTLADAYAALTVNQSSGPRNESFFHNVILPATDGLIKWCVEQTVEDRDSCYIDDDHRVARRVRKWCIANGDNPELRIALCGYEGEHQMPDTWTVLKWKAKGGYGSQRVDGVNTNPAKERIWFSPHCLKSRKPSLGIF